MFQVFSFLTKENVVAVPWSSKTHAQIAGIAQLILDALLIQVASSDAGVGS